MTLEFWYLREGGGRGWKVPSLRVSNLVLSARLAAPQGRPDMFGPLPGGTVGVLLLRSGLRMAR